MLAKCSLTDLSVFFFSQVFRSIGYKSIPLDNEVPFDRRKGVILNINGRVVNASKQKCKNLSHYCYQHKSTFRISVVKPKQK